MIISASPSRSSLRLVLATVAALALVACKGKSDPAPAAGSASASPSPSAAPAAAAKPSEPPAAAAPTPPPAAATLAGPGETILDLGDGVTAVPSTVTWTAAGHEVTFAVVKPDFKPAHLRALFDGRTLELGGPLDGNSMTYDLQLSKDRATVHFRARELVARAQEAGALFSFEDWKIGWDTVAKEPMIVDKWQCDETDAKGGVCKPPAWAVVRSAADDAGAADQELPDDQCCCLATLEDEKTGKERLQHTIMDETSCTRKTDDGKCVPMAECKHAK